MTDAEPGEPLAWKSEPSKRRLSAGDVVTTETSASWGGYASQIHRPYAIGTDPTDEYRQMFELAREVVEAMVDALRPGNSVADVHNALAPVETSPYKLYDVALHGYGNGYLPPYVGTGRSNYWPGMDDPVTDGWTFDAGELLVVQPNVVTPDERRGLQLGSAVVVREGGPEVLQEYPLGIQQV
jgi:Xaa-Pro aminopeptidase